MRQHHRQRSNQLGGRSPIDRRQNPDGFGQHEVGDPGTLCHESLGTCQLLAIVSRQQVQQDFGVNRVHGVGAWPGQHPV